MHSFGQPYATLSLERSPCIHSPRGGDREAMLTSDIFVPDPTRASSGASPESSSRSTRCWDVSNEHLRIF